MIPTVLRQPLILCLLLYLLSRGWVKLYLWNDWVLKTFFVTVSLLRPLLLENRRPSPRLCHYLVCNRVVFPYFLEPTTIYKAAVPSIILSQFVQHLISILRPPPGGEPNRKPVTPHGWKLQTLVVIKRIKDSNLMNMVQEDQG